MIKIIKYDIESQLLNIIQKYRQDVQLFLVSFAINFIIFGQKLFFYTIVSDDYMRFYGDHNTKLLITNSARWAQALLNDYIFIGNLQILPYLHGIIGIFAITLMGYLSAKYFERVTKIQIVFATLLVSDTPMFAHNLLFNTNITTWLSLLLGFLGFLMVHKGGKVKLTLGFIMIVFAIGNYQTFIQIIILLILIKAIIKLFYAQTPYDTKTIVVRIFLHIVLLLLAYIVSFYINEIFLHYHHWHTEHRLELAESNFSFSLLLEHLLGCYSTFVNFNYFKTQLDVLYLISMTIAVAGSLFFILSSSLMLLKLKK